MRIVGRNNLVKNIRAIQDIMKDDERCNLEAFQWLKPIAKLLGFNFSNDGEFWHSIPYIFIELYRGIPERYIVGSPGSLFRLWLEDQVLVINYDDDQEYRANEYRLRNWESRYGRRYDTNIFSPRFIFVVTRFQVKVFGQLDYDKKIDGWWYKKAIHLFEEYKDGVNNGIQGDINFKLSNIMDYYVLNRKNDKFREFADRVISQLSPNNDRFLPKHASAGRKFAELFSMAYGAYNPVRYNTISSPYDILLLWELGRIIFAFADEKGHISESEYERIISHKYYYNELIFFICKDGSVRYMKTRNGLKGFVARDLPPELDKKFHITEEVLVPVGEGVEELVNAKFNSKTLLMDLLDIKYDRNFLEYLENLKRRKPNTSYFRAQQISALVEVTVNTGDLVDIKFDAERLYYVYLDLLERNVPFYVSDIVRKINDLFKAGSFRIG